MGTSGGTPGVAPGAKRARRKDVGVTPLRRKNKEVYRIAFSFQGVQCRELLSLPHTASNDNYCRNLRAEILGKIARREFRYADFFPDSKRAELFGARRSDTLKEALEAYRDRVKSTLEYSTWVGYRKAIDNALIPWCGHMRIADLKPSDIRDWVGQQSMSLKSLQNKLLPLRAVLAEAVADEVIPVSPLDRVPLAKLVPIALRSSDYDPQPYTMDELVAVLAAVPVPARWGFQLWAFTGLRTGELIGLRWPRVDLIGKTIRISETTTSRRDKPRAKTKAGLRVIPLLPAALQAIEALRAYTQLAGDRVTVNPRSTRADQAWDDLTLTKVWQAAHRLAGVSYRQPYNLRHTYASQLLSQGENALHISKIMGHRTTDMVSKHYGRWIAEGAQLGFDRPARRYGMEPLAYVTQQSAACK